MPQGLELVLELAQMTNMTVMTWSHSKVWKISQNWKSCKGLELVVELAQMTMMTDDMISQHSMENISVLKKLQRTWACSRTGSDDNDNSDDMI